MDIYGVAQLTNELATQSERLARTVRDVLAILDSMIEDSKRNQAWLDQFGASLKGGESHTP